MSESPGEVKSPQRLRRIAVLKRIIVIGRVLWAVIPWVIILALLINSILLTNRLKTSEKSLVSYSEEMERLSYEIGVLSSVNDEMSEAQAPLVAQPETMEEPKVSYEDMVLTDEQLYDEYRKVYLTFDDGPSSNTEAILDILKEYNVKATFFVIYKEGPENEALYRRIVDEGHSLGMHSCTHEYSVVYASEEAFVADTQKLRDYLKDITGQEPYLYRFPGGSSNRVSTIDMRLFGQKLQDMGIIYYDWNVSSQDASKIILSADQIVYNSTDKLSDYSEAVILFHDTASKVTTVEALPQIIETIQGMEMTVILPISRETKPIQHISVNNYGG